MTFASLAQVVPHEQSEPRRVRRMIGRLQSDDRLGNPPVVFELDDRFMLVDGANRVAAMRALGYPLRGAHAAGRRSRHYPEAVFVLDD